jgi:hypothetical protein
MGTQHGGRPRLQVILEPGSAASKYSFSAA